MAGRQTTTENPQAKSVREEVLKELLDFGRALSEALGDGDVDRALDVIAEHPTVALANARFHEEIADKNRQLSALLETSKGINSDLNLKTVLNSIASNAAELLGADKSVVFLWNEEAHVLEIAAKKGLRGKEYDGLTIVQGEGVAGKVAESRRPLIVNDYQSSPYRLERFSQTSAFMAAPIVKGSELLGVIGVISEEEGVRFRRESLELLTLFALHAAIAVDNARLHGETKEHLKRLNSLIGIIKSLDITGDLDAAFMRSCTQIRRVFKTTGEAVCLVDPESNTLREVLGRGVAKKFSRLCEGVDCMLLRNGRTSLACRDPEAVDCPAYKVGKGEFLCAALKCGDTVYGTVRIHSRNGHGFRSGDRHFLEAVGEQMAGFVERDRLMQQVTHMAITDPLTGLFNRREFLREFDESVIRAERYRRPLSFLMMDLDNFKSYNDALGHQAGDALLKDVTALIRRYIRESDVFCRYGGDELCVILPETGKDEALIMAERIRKAVEAHQFEGEDAERGKITLTVGISSYPSGGKSRDELIQGADSALYRAKRRGRNRVFVYKEES